MSIGDQETEYMHSKESVLVLCAIALPHTNLH